MHKNINGYVGFIFVTLVISSVVGVARGLPIEQIVIRSIIATAIIGAAAYGLMRIGRRFLPELTGFGRSSESADETHVEAEHHTPNQPDSHGAIGNTVDMVVGDNIDILGTDEHPAGGGTAPASAPGAHGGFSENNQGTPAPWCRGRGVYRFHRKRGGRARAGLKIWKCSTPTLLTAKTAADTMTAAVVGDIATADIGTADTAAAGWMIPVNNTWQILAARPKEAAGIIRTILEDR